MGCVFMSNFQNDLISFILCKAEIDRFPYEIYIVYDMNMKSKDKRIFC